MMRVFPHNIEAYNCVKEAYKTTKRTCVVQPTGTGKTWIGLQLIEDFAAEKILYLTSYEQVRVQFMKNVKREVPQATQVDSFLYAGLKNVIPTGYKVIILDEFHRIGAEKWGKYVKRVLEANPDAFVLGLSATPIRYLDDKRNMADELFGGNVASEMTLPQAIAKGILLMPKYVTCLYSLKGEYAKAVKRVAQIASKNRREEAERVLKRAKSYLDKSKGLPEVFSEHMSNAFGRYLVFCRDIDHLCQMMQESKSKDWFAGVNKEVKYYKVSSDMLSSEILREVKSFEEDCSTSLKLLFCVDMMNEGYHLRGISGVILLRPTTSYNVYLQQIGRGFHAGQSESSLIIDIVRNLDCLSHVENLREEISVYFHGDASEFSQEFKIYSYMEDFVECMSQISSLAKHDWGFMYNLFCDYININGLDLIVKETMCNGYALGSWLSTQKVAYRKGMLSKERYELLIDKGG